MCNFHLKVKILPGDPRIAGPALPSPSAHNGLDCLFSQICENILDLTHNITLFSDSLQEAVQMTLPWNFSEAIICDNT